MTGALPATDIFNFWLVCIREEFFLRLSSDAWLLTMFVDDASAFKLIKCVGCVLLPRKPFYRVLFCFFNYLT